MCWRMLASTPSTVRITHERRTRRHCSRTYGQVKGSSTASAIAQRQNVIATGGASKRSARPMTQLPAQPRTARVRRMYGSERASRSIGAAAFREFLRQRRDDLFVVADDAEARFPEDRGLGIRIDRQYAFRVSAARHVVARAGNADRDIELRRDRPA